jgi:hypothetical protein
MLHGLPGCHSFGGSFWPASHSAYFRTVQIALIAPRLSVRTVFDPSRKRCLIARIDRLFHRSGGNYKGFESLLASRLAFVCCCRALLSLEICRQSHSVSTINAIALLSDLATTLGERGRALEANEERSDSGSYPSELHLRLPNRMR